MADVGGEMEFSLEEGEGEERGENVQKFRYLGRPPDQTDDDWPDSRQNIMHAGSFLERLGALIQWEWVEPRILALFYRAVVKEILLYRSEMWFLLDSTGKKVEGIHTGFF